MYFYWSVNHENNQIYFLNQVIAELYFILLKQTQRHISVRNC